MSRQLFFSWFVVRVMFRSTLRRRPCGGLKSPCQQAVTRMLEYDVEFLKAVEVGRASARRGDLLEHDEVVERIEQMFRS